MKRLIICQNISITSRTKDLTLVGNVTVAGLAVNVETHPFPAWNIGVHADSKESIVVGEVVTTSASVTCFSVVVGSHVTISVA